MCDYLFCICMHNICVFIYIHARTFYTHAVHRHAYMHALHCITLHYVTSHHGTLRYITLRYIALHYNHIQAHTDTNMHTYMPTHAYIHQT